ncbi:MAG: hypothetical protein CMN76_17040 [Spirochaetaceae bacterium]|nr:hypothetical protein [Spirochaetaceae bacterium]|tara:strand:+ start:32604 stop:32816 length:213 start_codon:yes stop_codon:yes gene_type:complete
MEGDVSVVAEAVFIKDSWLKSKIQAKIRQFLPPGQAAGAFAGRKTLARNALYCNIQTKRVKFSHSIDEFS